MRFRLLVSLVFWLVLLFTADASMAQSQESTTSPTILPTLTIKAVDDSFSYYTETIPSGAKIITKAPPMGVEFRANTLQSDNAFSRHASKTRKLKHFEEALERLGVGKFHRDSQARNDRLKQTETTNQEIVLSANLSILRDEDVERLLKTIASEVAAGNEARYVPVEYFDSIVISINRQDNVQNLRQQLFMKGVDVAEERLYKPVYTPNDPDYPSQWPLQSINYSVALSLGLGSAQPVIGILDNGINISNPELQDNIWINTDEVYGNGLDDDGNGYIDDRYGCNFDEYWVKNNTATACLLENIDDGDSQGYHGSNIAGIVAAVTNNGLKLAGVCPTCKIMNLDVADNITSTASLIAIIKAIEYAAAKGAKVVNFSYASTCPFDNSSDIMKPYIDTLINSYGIAYVQSAGNNGTISQNQCTSPASSSNPGGLNCGTGNIHCYSESRNYAYYYVDGKDVANAVFVASLDRTGQRSSFSTYDPDGGNRRVLTVAAPGSNIPVLYGGPASGTSFSAPIVAGAMGVILTKHARTPSQLKNAIEFWATPIVTDKNVSGRLLNLFQSYQNALAVYSDVPTTYTFFSNIMNLSVAGIVNGFGNGVFLPNSGVTRGQMAKFIRKAYGFTPNTACGTFTDVPDTNTFHIEIMTLKCLGIVNGYPDGSFRPDNFITRAEAMKFVMQGIRVRENNSEYLRYNGSVLRYSDVPLNYPFYEVIMAANDAGIVNGYGDNTFRPTATVTRGEMSKMIDIARAR